MRGSTQLAAVGRREPPQLPQPSAPRGRCAVMSNCALPRLRAPRGRPLLHTLRRGMHEYGQMHPRLRARFQAPYCPAASFFQFIAPLYVSPGTPYGRTPKQE